MESERESSMNFGWIFIVLLLFFGIFGGGFGCGGNGLFGRGNCGGAAAVAGTELADLVALRSVLGHKTMTDNCQTDRPRCSGTQVQHDCAERCADAAA